MTQVESSKHLDTYLAVRPVRLNQSRNEAGVERVGPKEDLNEVPPDRGARVSLVHQTAQNTWEIRVAGAASQCAAAAAAGDAC